jgi:ribosomal protein S27E/predicted RNA-binding Zn-ribbon protein involved in translation (DUF1610 family)
MENIENNELQHTHFECDSCGGSLVFDPKSQNLKCENCGSEKTIEIDSGKILFYDFSKVDEEEKKSDWDIQTHVVKCENCGGETVVGADEITKFCSFCGSPLVTKIDESPGIKPESVIPFKIGKKDALGRFKEWIKAQWMAPRSLKKEYNSGKIYGVYVPYWSYNTNTETEYTAQAGKDHQVAVTRTRVVDGRNETYTDYETRTNWRNVSGHHTKQFNDVLFNDGDKFNESTMEDIEPFFLEELKNFHPGFLSGFSAERAKNGVKAIWEKAKQKCKKIISGEIESNIRSGGADHVRNINLNTRFEEVKYRHMLLPVWISSYKFRGNTYHFYINGQTGEVQGKAPVSWLKVAGIVLAVAIVVAVLIMILW